MISVISNRVLMHFPQTPLLSKGLDTDKTLAAYYECDQQMGAVRLGRR